MINLIETLAGIAFVTGLAALVMVIRKRRDAARLLGMMTAIAGFLAAALELYVRLRE